MRVSEICVKRIRVNQGLGVSQKSTNFSGVEYAVAGVLMKRKAFAICTLLMLAVVKMQNKFQIPTLFLDIFVSTAGQPRINVHVL